MSRVVVIETNSSKLDFSAVKQGAINSFEGACNADGSFKKGWQPPGQWYVQHKSVGKYTVVHNQNTIDYAISSSLVKCENYGTVRSFNLTKDTFDIEIKRDSEYLDHSFRFLMSFRVIK